MLFVIFKPRSGSPGGPVELINRSVIALVVVVLPLLLAFMRCALVNPDISYAHDRIRSSYAAGICQRRGVQSSQSIYRVAAYLFVDPASYASVQNSIISSDGRSHASAGRWSTQPS
jgi:hypothetical protein